MEKALRFLKTLIEGIWAAVVLVWNLPVAIVEIIWTACFDREKFKANWEAIKAAIRGESRYE